jgi:hypothetical protein
LAFVDPFLSQVGNDQRPGRRLKTLFQARLFAEHTNKKDKQPLEEASAIVPFLKTVFEWAPE